MQHNTTFRRFVVKSVLSRFTRFCIDQIEPEFVPVEKNDKYQVCPRGQNPGKKKASIKLVVLFPKQKWGAKVLGKRPYRGRGDDKRPYFSTFFVHLSLIILLCFCTSLISTARWWELTVTLLRAKRGWCQRKWERRSQLHWPVSILWISHWIFTEYVQSIEYFSEYLLNIFSPFYWIFHWIFPVQCEYFTPFKGNWVYG